MLLQRWLELAPERVQFQGLPARICWLGLGDRARAGLAINELVRSGKVKAPVVIGRDHLDSGSVASPYRETEAMRDGSDAIADWPILNALVNVAAGATWVSVHHGGGVGIGNSIHAGMVVVADGTDEMAERLERVLTTDPATGVLRHVDAGYEDAVEAAARRRARAADAARRLRVSSAAEPTRLLVRDLAQAVASAAGPSAPLRGPALGEVEVLEDAFVLCAEGRITDVGRMRDLAASRRRRGGGRRARALRAAGLRRLSHACVLRAAIASHEFELRAGGASYEELHAAGGGILSTVAATRAAGEEALRAAVRRHRAWMLRAGTTTFEGKSGYGLDLETELASLRAISAEGGVPTWLGAHAVPPEHDDADAYLDFSIAEVLPEAARVAEAADVFVERGAFTVEQARRYLEACREAGLVLRLHADQFSEQGAIGLAIELGARSVDHLEATGEEGIRRLAASEVVGVVLPVAALVLGRPMPRARELVDAGGGAGARHRLQPRQRLLRVPTARRVAGLHAASALAGRGAQRDHRQRCTRAGPRGSARAARAGVRRRRRPARRARLEALRVPPRRRARDRCCALGPAQLAALG